MEVVVTTGATRHAKFQSKCHRQQTNTQIFTGLMPFLSPNQQCQSTEEMNITTTPSKPPSSFVTNKNCIRIKNNISYSDHSIGRGDDDYFYTSFTATWKRFLLPSYGTYSALIGLFLLTQLHYTNQHLLTYLTRFLHDTRAWQTPNNTNCDLWLFSTQNSEAQ